MATLLQILAALPALILALLNLMTLAETALPESGTGLDKKTYVLEAIKAMFSIGDDLWKKVQGMISAIINFMAVFHFSSKLPKEPLS